MDAKDLKRDLPTALVALLIAATAAAAVWEARTFSTFGSIFPLVTGVTLLLVSLAVFVRGVTVGSPAKELAARSPTGMRNSLMLIAVLVAWALALEWAGFVMSSWVSFVVLALIADNRRPTLRRSVNYAVVALIVVVGLQFLFGRLLNVMLP